MSEQPDGNWLTPKDHTRRTGPFRVRSRRERQRERAITDWFGDADLAEAEIGAHKRDGSPLGEICETVLSQLDTPNRRTMRKLMEHWDQVAGGFASQCSPRNLRDDGTLFVAVASPALAFQLRLQERTFLQRIEALGLMNVRTLRFCPAGATHDEQF